ncbi:MAG: molybdopterin-dependent oxidoreductase [Planctomycetota bacterium]
MTRNELRTTCNRDCPDACGILATVENGVVKSLRGDPAHPVTRGFLCLRTSRFPEQQASSRRIRQPLVRRGDKLEPASWPEALDLIESRFRRILAESGPAALFHYRSGGSLGLLKHLADRFFDLLGPCTQKVGDICSGAGEAAQLLDFGTSDSNDLFDLRHSRHVVLWGKNPKVSNVHVVPLLQELRAAGTTVWLIDPIHHKSVPLADRYVQPAPGRDFELAMAITRELADRGQLDPAASSRCDHYDDFLRLVQGRSVGAWASAAEVGGDQVQALAGAFADRPAAILVGWGMQRRARGGAIVRALDALSAVTGNLWLPGGGASFYFRRRKAFRDFVVPVAGPRTIREPVLGHDLLATRDPPVRGMWVTAGNPVAMLPDSANVAHALAGLEFLVVADCFLTETAELAHVVLPVPTLLEDSDVLGAYGHHWLGESRPVVAAPPEVWHEARIFQELARRFGLAGFPQGSPDELKQQVLADVAAQGCDLDTLRRHGAVRSPVSPAVLFADGRVPTASGRVNLLTEAPPPADLEAPPPHPGASAPLWLFSNSTEKSQASQWVGDGLGKRTWVVVHPDAVPGMAAGDIVVVASAHGRLEAELRLDDRQRHDVAVMPKGGHFGRGQSANALIAARPTDLGLGAAYLDCLVRISPR